MTGVEQRGIRGSFIRLPGIRANSCNSWLNCPVSVVKIARHLWLILYLDVVSLHTENMPMSLDLTYRFMQPGEEHAVYELVRRVFDRFIAPGFIQQGVDEFVDYIEPDKLATRAQSTHVTLLAIAEPHQTLVGVIEIRQHRHISLLFVDEDYQRKGIAQRLMNKGIDLCCRHNPDLTFITVFSSPYAVDIYKCLGFTEAEPEQELNGVRFIPMVRYL